MIHLHDSAAAVPAAGTARTYVALAAGSDLAALAPLVAARLLDEPLCSFLVFYGHYGEVSDAALEELLGLKDQHLGRLALHFIMEREPEEGELLSGKLDADKLRAVAAQLFEPLGVHQYFLLGTGSAVAPLRAQLLDLGVAPAKIQAAAAAAAAPTVVSGSDAALPASGETQVEVIMDGRRRAFSMHTGTESILEAATRAGLDLPFSCRAGVCSTCRTKLVRGEVELTQNYALEDWELAQGFILACQAHAKTAELEITYDET
jgi:ring-1,2-phenylacetyl-CoA epoxidase subunit PaaE